MSKNKFSLSKYQERVLTDSLADADPYVTIKQTGEFPRGEKSLWFCVLLIALRDFLKFSQNGISKSEAKVYLRQTRKWFASDSEEVGTFRWVAQVVGINADLFRDAIFDGDPDVKKALAIKVKQLGKIRYRIY